MPVTVRFGSKPKWCRKDKASDEVLISATVKLVPENGSALFTTTDLSGQFYFNKLKSGTYVLNISYVGYKAFMETVKIANTSNKINVYMQENSQLLGEVAVTGRATRTEQRGDSLMYNAEAFKVMQEARLRICWQRCPVLLSRAVLFRLRESKWKRF